MFIAGIPGFVEDLSTWKEWLAMLSLWKWFSVICVSVGFFLILYGLISRNGIDRIVENDELSRLAALESLKARIRFRVRRVAEIEFPGDGGLCIEASSTVTGTVNCTRDEVGNLNSISLLSVPPSRDGPDGRK